MQYPHSIPDFCQILPFAQLSNQLKNECATFRLLPAPLFPGLQPRPQLGHHALLKLLMFFLRLQRRAPWKKLPLGTRMERLGGKLCLLDGRVEDHEHVFRHCMFSAFMQSTVRKAFGMVESGGVKVEPSRLLRNFPLLSNTTTQGLLLWAGLKA